MTGTNQRLGRAALAGAGGKGWPRDQAAGVLRAAAIVALAALAGGVPLAGCKSGSGSTKPGQATGSVSLALALSPGVSIASVSWVIVGPAGFTRTGSIDVSSSQTLSTLIGGIPVGTGYQITATATASDGTTTCAGNATFNIMAGATSQANLHLTCNAPGRTGSVLINGTINVCPVIDGVTASPAEVLTINKSGCANVSSCTGSVCDLGLSGMTGTDIAVAQCTKP